MTDALSDEQGRRLDQIQIVGLAGFGHHGVFEHERAEGQNFVVDVTVHLDTRGAAHSDEVTSTVHYGEVSEDVVAVITGEPVDLIETLAARIADVVLARPGAFAVDVAVHKPQAPITVPFSDVIVSIRRLASEVRRAAPVVVEDEPFDEHIPADMGPVPVPVPNFEPAPEPALVAALPVPEPTPELAPIPTAAELGILDEWPESPVEVVLALGANLGSPQSTLREAIAELHHTEGLSVLKVSPIARTTPVGGPEQPDYLNAVLIGETTLSPRELLNVTQGIENDHGRERLEANGPRTLDIDVITYGDITSDDAVLTIPHPRARERAFVLVPWVHVQPEGILQGVGYVSDVVDHVDQSGIRYLALDWFDPKTLEARLEESLAAGPDGVPVPETADGASDLPPANAQGQAPESHSPAPAAPELNTGAVKIPGAEEPRSFPVSAPSFDEIVSPGSDADGQNWTGS